MTSPSPLRSDAPRPDDHDRGLRFDLSTMVRRRHALKLFAGAGAMTLVGCGSQALQSSGTSGNAAAGGSTAATAKATTTTSGAAGPSSSSSSASPSTTAAAAEGSCTVIPQETGGPYPGDGSNGPNVLTQSGAVRNDIRSSFGSSSTVAGGVPLTIRLNIVDTGNGCAPYEGAAVYLWHCDREGRYSLYSNGVTGENYLRGIQAADGSGLITFTSIFPAAYSGRWPHVHFEVFEDLATATSAGSKLRTSQLALPKDVCSTVYATDGYSASVRNLASTSLERDNVFSDGYSLQMAKVSGSVGSGLVAELTVPV